MQYKSNLSGSGDVLNISLETSYNPFIKYSNSNLLALTENLLKSQTIYPRFRIFVLNQDETVQYEIPQEDILLGGNYQENYQNGQRRSLSFELNNNLGNYTPSANGFWLNTKFSLDIGLQMRETEDSVLWFKKGVYIFSEASPAQTSEKKSVSFSLKDKFAIFESSSGKLTSSYSIPVGTEIERAINDLIMMDNGNGMPLDPKPIIYHSSLKGKKTQQTISGEAGSSAGEILLALAQQASAEIFYNAEGNLTLVPIVETANEFNKPIIYNFYSDEGDFTSIDYDFQLQDIVNRIIVVGSNINGGTTRAEAINTNPESPINIQRIGYRTADVINDSNITNKILAEERAQYELRKASIIQTTVSNGVYFNPILSVNNLISLTDDFFNAKEEKLLIQSISFDLNYEGVMQISSTNIKNLSLFI